MATDEDRKLHVGNILFVAWLVSLIMTLIFEALFMYNFFEVIHRDLDKIGGQPSLLFKIGLFFCILSLTFFVWWLKKTLPKNKKVGGGICALFMGAPIFIGSLLLCILALFNRYSINDSSSFLRASVGAAILFSIAAGFILLGCYKIISAKDK
ncbi:MAG: hypothetical protein ACD_7C00491G0001 [uncultured bacterium]|nr:MAG: hypothetical protein ACD_7C00491G0001 [uncultured bacterium]